MSPLIRVAVETKNPADLPKLVEGLKHLAKSDPMVQCMNTSPTSTSLPELVSFALRSASRTWRRTTHVLPKKSEPVVSLTDGLSEDIENGEVNPTDDLKTRSRYMADKYDYDVTKARKIWDFGLDQRTQPND